MDVAFCVQLNNLAAFSRTEAPRHRRGSPLVQGRWFRSVCMFLEEWGLRPQGPGQWHGPQGEVVSLATGNRDAVQRSLHVLREMWRKAQWHQFLEHHRHEAVLYDKATSRTRKSASSSPGLCSGEFLLRLEVSCLLRL